LSATEDVLPPLFSNFALEYVLRKVQRIRTGCNWIGSSPYVYVDGANLSGKHVRGKRKNTEAL
jgi:hypothetical protein